MNITPKRWAEICDKSERWDVRQLTVIELDQIVDYIRQAATQAPKPRKVCCLCNQQVGRHEKWLFNDQHMIQHRNFDDPTAYVPDGACEGVNRLELERMQNERERLDMMIAKKSKSLTRNA